MKPIHIFGLFLLILLQSCHNKDRWNVDLKDQNVEVNSIDISKDFFNPEISLKQLQGQYPFFFDQLTPDSIWEKQRREPTELKVYASIKKTFPDKSKLDQSLAEVFKYFKYYYPLAKTPKVFTYSSGLQSVYEPVLYSSKDGLMFIALDGFLGDKSKLYDSIGVYNYLRQNMHPESLEPMVVNAMGSEIAPLDPRQQKFIDQIIFEGKKLILADAFIPKTADSLKIGYTAKQIEWCKTNEGQIWNYFLEQNYLFSSDKSLADRFLKPAPFSKFQNNIEGNSPGRIGAWLGWQICRKYLEENPKVTLQEFMANLDAQQIFTASKYKPVQNSDEYVPSKEPVQETSEYDSK